MSPDLTALMSERASACGPSRLCFHSSGRHLISASVPPPLLSPLSVSRSIIVQLSLANICSFLWNTIYHSLSLSTLFFITLRFFLGYLLSANLVTFTVMPLAMEKNASKNGKNIHNCIYLFSIIAAILITGDFFGKLVLTLTKNTFVLSEVFFFEVLLEFWIFLIGIQCI